MNYMLTGTLLIDMCVGIEKAQIVENIKKEYCSSYYFDIQMIKSVMISWTIWILDKIVHCTQVLYISFDLLIKYYAHFK